MVSALPPNARTPASGSIIARWLERTAALPGTFKCGVRWPDHADARHRRWRYRRAWIDPYREGGAMRIRLDNGEVIRIRLDDDPWWHDVEAPPRPGFTVLSARSVDDGACILLAVPDGHLAKFEVGGL
jgi:hypothetical protein